MRFGKALAAFLMVMALGSAGARAATPVDEEGYVSIGGIAQWITIKGQDRGNPVLLLLHGGPAVTFTPEAAASFKGWDKDFTLVEWDQRGAGRTFTRNGDEAIAPSMTLDRMVQDGIDVARYAAAHLAKKKVIVMGASWGSILGVHMIRKAPELFYAYVGPAQIVDAQKNAALVYARVLKMARAAGDTQAIATFEKIGPPPWHRFANLEAYQKVEQVYQRKLAPRPPDYAISPAYASPSERADWRKAVDFSGRRFFGENLDGPLATTNLPALGLDFSVPVFVIQGEHDMTALPELARDYVAAIKAPQKGFFLLPGAGHAPGPELWALTHKVLMEKARPLARN